MCKKFKCSSPLVLAANNCVWHAQHDNHTVAAEKSLPDLFMRALAGGLASADN